jgi:hypothetical protein
VVASAKLSTYDEWPLEDSELEYEKRGEPRRFGGLAHRIVDSFLQVSRLFHIRSSMRQSWWQEGMKDLLRVMPFSWILIVEIDQHIRGTLALSKDLNLQA